MITLPLPNKPKDYIDYLNFQIKTSSIKVTKDGYGRYRDMLLHLLPLIKPKGKKMLCVGCRNKHELFSFEQEGFEVTGIDLISDDKQVQLMDMHDMSFKNDTFDVVYAGDSLEHTYNPNKAIAEIVRVMKDGLLCVIIPIEGVSKTDFTTGDCQSFKNKEEFYSLIKTEYKVEYEALKNDTLTTIIKIK